MLVADIIIDSHARTSNDVDRLVCSVTSVRSSAPRVTTKSLEVYEPDAFPAVSSPRLRAARRTIGHRVAAYPSCPALVLYAVRPCEELLLVL